MTQTGGNGARLTVKVNLNQEQKSLFDGKSALDGDIIKKFGMSLNSTDKKVLLLRFLYDKPADLHRHQRRERANRRFVVRRETAFLFPADLFTSDENSQTRY